MTDEKLQVEALRDVGIKMFSTRSVDRLVDFILCNVLGLFGVTSVALLIYDEEHDQLRLRDARGEAAQDFDDDLITNQADLAGRLQKADALADFSDYSEYFAEGEGFKYIQVLKHKDKLVGALLLGPRAAGEGFGDYEKKLVAVFSAQIAAALQNNRLYEELRRKNKILRETQQELVQSVKLAAIGEFAAGVAHELNNPLVSMSGYTRLLKKKLDSEETLRYVDIIDEEIERSKNIIDDLLTYARRGAEEGLKTFDLADVVKEVSGELKSRFERRGVDFDLQITDEICEIHGDPAQIKQVVSNLLANALEAVGSGDGEVKVELGSDGTRYRLIVADNGPGIDPQVQDKIFDPFFTTKESGTGLGLSIVYNILDSHGADISLTSDPEGTEFKISFLAETN